MVVFPLCVAIVNMEKTIFADYLIFNYSRTCITLLYVGLYEWDISSLERRIDRILKEGQTSSLLIPGVCIKNSQNTKQMNTYLMRKNIYATEKKNKLKKYLNRF